MTTHKEALIALVHEMEYVLSCINEDKIPFDGDDFHEALRLGKEALAQPEQEPDLGGVDVFYPKDEHYKTVISDVQRLFDDKRQSASDAVQKEIDAYKAANPHCDVIAIVGDLAPYRRRTLGLPDSTPLYTTPPQRKPLTDDEFLELLLRDGTSEVVGYCTFVGGSIQMQGRVGLLRSAKVIKQFIEFAYGIKE